MHRKFLTSTFFLFLLIFSMGYTTHVPSLASRSVNPRIGSPAKIRLLKQRTRTNLINYLIEKNQYETYLEVGVADGDNFCQIQIAHKDGVDPGGGHANYAMTSDDFFAQNTKTYDIIFIDGLHLCEQVLRDVDNSLKCVNPGGVIVMHDCLPTTYEQQLPSPIPGSWNGDVWKAAAQIRMHYPDVHFCVVNMDWGCGILTPNSDQILYPAVSFQDLDWNYFVKHRYALLNVVTLENWLNSQK